MSTIKILATAISLVCTTAAIAGDLNAPSAPTDPGSAMHTLEDVYDRMTTGAAGAKRPGAFLEPGSAPGSTGHTLDEVMSKAPEEDNVNGVQPAGALAGETYWSLRTDGTWGAQAGEMQNNGIVIFTPGTGDQAVEGYYSDTSKVTGDADLTSENIKSGANIFGVDGNTNVVNTSTGDAVAVDILTDKKAWVDGVEITGTANISAYPALVPRTGQTTCYDTAGAVESPCATLGQDADVLAGESWPNPRFQKNASGTNDDGSGSGGVSGDGICNGTEICDGSVTDNLTGLVWLQNANCASFFTGDATGINNRSWENALTAANNLTGGFCGLTDGSSAGDWHLPNRNELNSLIDSEYNAPALSNAAGTAKWSEGDAFSGVASNVYWSSTTAAAGPAFAWIVGLYYGDASAGDKADSYYVWPVRAGQ